VTMLIEITCFDKPSREGSGGFTDSEQPAQTRRTRLFVYLPRNERTTMRLNYVIVFLSDMKRAVSFYRDVLGLPPGLTPPGLD